MTAQAWFYNTEPFCGWCHPELARAWRADQCRLALGDDTHPLHIRALRGTWVRYEPELTSEFVRAMRATWFAGSQEGM